MIFIAKVNEVKNKYADIFKQLPGETAEEYNDRTIRQAVERDEAEEKATEEAAKSKAVGTVTIPNDNKLNITTGVNKLQEIQENNMANELDVTEVDMIKQEKMAKQKKKEEDVLAAIAIAADLKGDIQKIKEELCVGPDCLKEQVKNKFGEIDAKIAKLDAKAVEFYSCDRCGYDRVPALSSFCPQCGLRIPSWNTDEGEPVPGWSPYWQTHKEEQVEQDEN